MDHHPEPDELASLEAARPDPSPNTSTTEAHREALTAAMQRERISPQRRPAMRRVLVAAAAIPVLAGAAFFVTQASEPAQDVGGIQLAASHAFYDAPRCGDDPPPDLTIPDGFTGPIDGPSPDSDAPAAADQLVRHWTSGSTNIELRWYADPDAVPPPVEPWSSSEPVEVGDGPTLTQMVGGGGALPSGRYYFDLVSGTTQLGVPANPCTWVQLTFYGSDLEAANEAMYAVTGMCHTPLPEPGEEPPSCPTDG
jgi:hypothetical protein